jgi:hypothetical protein
MAGPYSVSAIGVIGRGCDVKRTPPLPTGYSRRFTNTMLGVESVESSSPGPSPANLQLCHTVLPIGSSDMSVDTPKLRRGGQQGFKNSPES